MTNSIDTDVITEAAEIAAEEARKQEIEELYSELNDQTRMVQNTRQLLTSLAKRRRDTVLALRDKGQTHKQIADKLGLSKSAIQQIIG